jgi:phage terminase Nu1 subunit (DNA packaging protein)
MLRDHSGVKAAKPRLKPAKEELPELSREYLLIRNEQMRTKNLMAEMQLAERRGELIEKRLVEAQAVYLIVALRQAVLNVPQTWCRRLTGVNDAAQVSKILREMAVSILNEIKDLPSKVTDPHWLRELEADGNATRNRSQRRR